MKKILLFALIGAFTLGTVNSCKKDDKDVFYTVTFNSEGGSAVSSQRVLEGAKATKPSPDPTRAGYDFVQWATSSTGGTAWNFPTDAVKSNITLYAQWESSTAEALAALTALIDEAGDLTASNFTDASWAALQTALNAAKQIGPTSTAAEIKAATDALQSGLDNLVPSATNPDKALLEDAINAAKALNEGNYDADDWADLQAALEAAEAVDADPNATVNEVNQAYNDLEGVINGLVFNPNAGGNNGSSGGGSGTTTGGGGTPTAADKGALETAIANAESKVQANYTADSWSKMQTALANAKSIDTNANASQAQVNAAASNLRLATAQLVSNSSADPGSTDPGGADKSALKSAMDSSNALVEANYTADSWAVLQNDLANAQKVYDNADASQQQVNTALATLQTGINNLKRSTANDGLVSSLLNQLISLVNSLPSVSAIQNNPLLVAATIPVATLADTVRDQLTSLLGTDNPQVASLSSTLNGVLGAVGLSNLI